MQTSQFKLVGQTRPAHPQEIESQLMILVSDPALVTAWRGLCVEANGQKPKIYESKKQNYKFCKKNAPVGM